MNKISSTIDLIQESYDVVVVGSGYGGGITASRLSRAGKKVCLLERGKEFLLGDFPDNIIEASKELQLDTCKGKVGSPTGLYNIHVNAEQNVVVGCGLGGTSLINANVSLEAKPEVFDDPRWPDEIRTHRSTLLKDGIERAREMLKPNPYPNNKQFPPLNKTKAHEKSAKFMGQAEHFYRPPINVTFEPFENDINHVGVEQPPCTNCGDCVSGCNYGSKNTVQMNYLPDAHNHGAEIYCEVPVSHVEKVDGGWLVHYQQVGVGREKFDAPYQFVKADVVVLCAGTMGSTEIMLRSRDKGLDVSAQLGKNFTGNGDILGFGYNNDEEIHGIGFGHHEKGDLPPVGPCITSIIDMRYGDDWRDRMVIEEGSMPGALSSILPGALSFAADAVGRDTDSGIWDATKEKARELESAIRGAYEGAIDNTQTYLIMSHDDGKGVMSLHNDKVQVDWPDVGEQINFVKGNEMLYQATKALGGEYVENPIWNKLFNNSIITVHPLGGCVMGKGAEQGVTNHKNQVFSGKTGTAVHPGLYVSDGSIIPTSLAVNPLLTISAMAERCCVLMAQDYGWSFNYDLPSRPAKPPEPLKLGIEFTETMKGYFSTSFQTGESVDDYEDSAKIGESTDSPMQFTLTIASDDLDEIINSPQHNARISGTVIAPQLSEDPLMVTDGVFNLFVRYPETPETKHMNYNMQLTSTSGETFYFRGYKIVKDNSPLSAWPDTSTLYVTVFKGDKPQGDIVGKGVLHIKPSDFAIQMTTMQATNAKNLAEKIEATARFGAHFAGVMWEAYGGIFNKEQRFDPDAPPRKKRPLKTDAPEVHFFDTEDGVNLKLTRFQGGTKGPVMLVHGLGVASSIFSTDTISTNLTEYLFAHDYDVWLLDFRVSIDIPAGEDQCTGDDVAKYDFPAAVELIKQQTGSDTIQALVHCYGATTFFMSMLAGLKDIRTIVCSQIACNIVLPLSTKIKTGLHVPSFLEKLGVKELDAYTDKKESFLGRMYDKAMEVNAMIGAQGQCDSPVCHRITFMYSSLYRHDTLNDKLHSNLHELFGEANITTLKHLSEMCRNEHLVSADGEEIYMPNIANLNLPICFISGENNECYLPESTELTYKMLQGKFGKEQYSRHVIENYGHIDCIFGKNAAIDVYPIMLAHLEKTA